MAKIIASVLIALLLVTCAPTPVPPTVTNPSATPQIPTIPASQSTLAPPNSTITFTLPDVTPSGPACGLERWPVKTLADKDAAKVDFSPKQTDISTLRSLQAPPNLPKDQRISPTELETYEVTVQVKEFKLEDDSDIHVVISTIGKPNETMIVELVDVGCTQAGKSSQREAMLAARQAFVSICGTPSTSRFKPCSAQVTIAGVGFFDFLHGQTGVAPNGIELHPVLGVSELTKK